MAVSNYSVTDTYDALLSTTLRNYRKKLEDNIFGDLPLLWWLNDKGRKRTVDGGYQIAVPLLYGENSTVKLYSGYEVLDVTPQEGITTAMYPWKQMAVAISISRVEERKNSGAHRLINLLESKTMQAEKSMQWYLNDLLHGVYGSHGTTFIGDSTNAVNSVGGTISGATLTLSQKGFNSLDHIVRSGWGMVATPQTAGTTTHSVGGISVALTHSGAGSVYEDWVDPGITAYTNPWWMNYSNPGFARLQRGTEGGVLGDALSITELDYAANALDPSNTNQNVVAAMRSMYNRLSSGSDHPDLLLSGQPVYELYESALMPLERFTDTKLGDAGFQNLKFKGATMMMDHGITTQFPTTVPTAAAPAPPLYFLNSKYLEWTVDTQTDFMTTPFYRPENQDARTAQILLMANLCCSNRSKHGVVSYCTAGGYTP